MPDNFKTAAAEFERDIAAIVAEQYAHGASEKDVTQLVRQLKIVASEEHNQLTDKIPE